jgi:PAS domain S-box-containing protein
LRSVFPGLLEAAELADLALWIEVERGDDGDEGRTMYVSEAAARLLGASADELRAGSLLQAFTASEREHILGIHRRCRRGEQPPPVTESIVVHKDGTEVSVEIASTVGRVDGRAVTIMLLRDVTERHHSDDVFRKLMVTAPDAVVVSRAREIVHANHRYLELLGYSSVAEVRAALDTQSVLHPDDRARGAERAREIRAGARPWSQLNEYRLLRKDGSAVCVDCSSVMIDFEGGPALLTFVRDVTKRRELEAQLIQTDRMAAIGTLAAGVAHEINNPLAYVMLNVTLLERELEEMVAGSAARRTVRERLTLIQEGTAHIAGIVRDLRSFCRADSPPHPVDVRQVLESAINMAMTELGGRARLIRDYSPVRPILADGARLGQVFLNLLVNAVQSLTEGPPDKNEIRVTLQPDGVGYVSIEIKDTGQGIAPGDLERVFEPFFTTKPPGMGTGLGLSISQSIVHGMMGQLTVESELGKGSSFRVRLPAGSQKAE